MQEELTDIGFKLSVYPLPLLGVCISAMQEALKVTLAPSPYLTLPITPLLLSDCLRLCSPSLSLQGLKDGKVPVGQYTFGSIKSVVGFPDYFQELEEFEAYGRENSM